MSVGPTGYLAADHSRYTSVEEVTSTVWRLLTATGLAVAGLTSLGYAAWVLTVRRALFADVAASSAGGDAVSLVAARSSDAAEAAWGWATGVCIVAALALWCATRFVDGQRLGSVGFAALALVGAGLVVATLGSVVASTVGSEPAQAGRAAVGSSVVGIGLLLVSSGLLTGVAAVLRGQPAPYLGYAGWGTG